MCKNKVQINRTAISTTNQLIRYQNVSILNFIRAKDDGGGGDNWSYETCEAQSPPNQHPAFYRPDALPVT